MTWSYRLEDSTGRKAKLGMKDEGAALKEMALFHYSLAGEYLKRDVWVELWVFDGNKDDEEMVARITIPALFPPVEKG